MIRFGKKRKERKVSSSYKPSPENIEPQEQEAIKLGQLVSAVEARGLTFGDDREMVRNVLYGKYASGNPRKALELLLILRDAEDSLIKDIDPNYPLVGSENLKGLTCYLDALLFSMFARSTSFDVMLYAHQDDPQKHRLSVLLRAWVNMLRTGKLITTDIVQQFIECLSACGWEDVLSNVQQDASEAFTLITETLDLPMLALKVKLQHGGQADADDDKFISERILNVPIPDTVNSSQDLTLEQCMEEFFANEVHVRRPLERSDTANSIAKAEHSHVEDVGLSTSPVSVKHRSRRSSNQDSKPREWDMKAWQFFQLLPFYSTVDPTNRDLSQYLHDNRPMLCICLKRYGYNKHGVLSRNDRRIKIPHYIDLPPWVVGEEDIGDGIARSWRLSLQSAVCHRGNSLNSGHYISLVKDTDSKWLRFDDLNEPRVTVSADAKTLFKEETPYLVFYQLKELDKEDVENGKVTDIQIHHFSSRSRTPLHWHREKQESSSHRGNCHIM